MRPVIESTSASERADSSGLALLLEWQALARQQQRKLKISNAPDTLLSLARLCEADNLLESQPAEHVHDLWYNRQFRCPQSICLAGLLFSAAAPASRPP